MRQSNTPRIGIVGGGQLAQMMTLAAKSLGFFVIVIDPTPHSPAGQVADKQIVAGYKDKKATLALGKRTDFMTVDAEFVNDEALEILARQGKPVNPSPETIRMIKDKLQQKEFLKNHSIATAEFVEVTNTQDIENAAKQFRYPMLLKAREDAYDGKGNYVIKNKNDISNGLAALKNRTLYVEQFVPFVKELAVMIARDMQGNIALYPVVETIHKNNICDTVLCPAPVSEIARKNAEILAKNVMQHLKGAGVFGIEMFLKKDDTVLVNELAPRVHNSGHYTIEGCITSQFEQHIRAIAGLPLGATDLLPQAVVMKNILGEKTGNGYPQGLANALAIPHVSVHLYGKHESRPGRKMGHITVIANSLEEGLQKANQARKMLIL